MEDSESLVSWSWWTPTSGTTIGSHRGTQHRGPSATRAANHIKDYIKFDRSEGTLTFQPLGGSDVTTVIRTRQKVPQDKPVYMFEVHLVSAQAATPSSRIAVGVQFNESVLNRLPGADRSSLGVHHDTGLLHSDNSDGTPFFQYGPGDTITVAINFVTDSILLYKNGLSRGAALVGLPGGGTVYPVVGFDHAEACVVVNLGHKPFRYPAVLEALKAEVRDHVLRAIDSTPPLLLDGTSKSEDDKSKDDKSKDDSKKKKSCREKADVDDEKQPTEKSAAGKGAQGKSGKQQAYESSAAEAAATQAASAAHTAQLRVILDHLVHASCWKSADAISKLVMQRTVPLHCAVQPEGTLETKIGGSEGRQNDTGSSGAPMELEVKELGQLPGDTLDDMRQRQAVMEHMLSGRIEQAVQEAERVACGVLDDDPEVKFEVRLQQFLEMLSDDPSAEQQLEAMNFARCVLKQCATDCPTTKQDTILSEALMLLAFAKPSSSSVSHLLSPQRRQQSAAALNGALMLRRRGHKRSGLDRLCRHLVAVHQEMVSNGVLAAGALDVREILSNCQST